MKPVLRYNLETEQWDLWLVRERAGRTEVAEVTVAWRDAGRGRIQDLGYPSAVLAPDSDRDLNFGLGTKPMEKPSAAEMLRRERAALDAAAAVRRARQGG